MFAILSDIHANLEALTAVLADIDRHGVERVVCLGDIVVYGPDPVACIDLVRERFEGVIMGYFDQAVIFGDRGYGSSGFESIQWTRRLLDSPTEPRDAGERRWAFLAELPRSLREGDTLYVHGSARNPTLEYVYPEDIYNPGKLKRIFDLIPHVCFCGLTHLPGVLNDRSGRYDVKTRINYPSGGDGEYTYYTPEELGHAYRIDQFKTIINVGSVGQPRDGDPCAAYALVEGGHVRFRRVDYDMGTTIRKIYDNPDLRDMDGDRLRDGR